MTAPHRRVKIDMSPPNRVCAHPGCERILSIYNHTDLCKTHGDMRINSDGRIDRRSTRDGVTAR